MSKGDVSKVRLGSSVTPPRGNNEENCDIDSRLALSWVGHYGIITSLPPGIAPDRMRSIDLSKESKAMRRFGHRLKARYPEHYGRLLLWKNRLISRFDK
jgi:hypothetical protein